MKARLANTELQGWVAYYSVSPLSNEWAGVPFGGSGGGVKPQQTIEEQKAIFARAQRAWNRKGT